MRIGRKMKALTALVLAASLVFSACPQPDSGTNTEVPTPDKTYNASISLSFGNNKIPNGSIDITIPKSENGKRNIGNKEIEFTWTTEHQKNAGSFTVDIKGEGELPSGLIGEIVGALTIQLASDSEIMSDREKGVIAGKTRDALPPGISFDLVGDKIGGEYDIESPITLTATCNGNPQQITLTVLDKDNGSIQWEKKYRGITTLNLKYPLNPADKSIFEYDLGTLARGTGNFNLGLATIEADYNREITNTDLGTLRTQLGTIIQRNVDAILDSLLDPKDNYTVISESKSIKLGGLDAAWQQVGNKVELTINRGDTDPTQRTDANIATFMSKEFNTLPSAITGKDVDIIFKKDETGAKGDIPISYIYYVKKAVSDKAGAGKTVKIDIDKDIDDKPVLVPSYSSNDWILLSSRDNSRMYSLFDTIDVGQIIEGLSIESIDGKKVLTYERPIQIDHISYDNNFMTDIYGFGIKSGNNGSIVPISGNSWENVVISGPRKYSTATHALTNVLAVGRVDSWADYMEQLAKAGLSCIQLPDGDARNGLTNAPFPKHNIEVSASTSPDKNVMSNLIYDLFIVYDSNGKKNYLDNVSFSGGWTLNGNAAPANVPARTFPGINGGNALNANNRIDNSGNINPTYKSNIPSNLFEYVITKCNINDILNVNLYDIKASDLQPNVSGHTNILYNKKTNNIGLVFGSEQNNPSASRTHSIALTSVGGVINVKVDNLTDNDKVLISGSDSSIQHAYLKIETDNNNSPIIGYNKALKIVDVSNIDNTTNTGKGNTASGTGTWIILFRTKHQSDIIDNGIYSIPTKYRAFVGSDGTTKKYAPSSGLSDPKWQSPTNPTGQDLPSLNIHDWETMGNNATPTIPLMQGNDKIWSATDFNVGGPISLAPAAPSNLRLATGMPEWARMATAIDVLLGRKRAEFEPLDPGISVPRGKPFDRYVAVVHNKSKERSS